MSDDHIEIDVPHGSRIHRWLNIIATGGAVAIAVASILKPADPLNKASYDELKGAIEQNQKEISRTHEDTISLKNYMEGYMKGIGSVYPIPGPSSSAMMVPIGSGGAPGTAGSVTLAPMDRSKLSRPIIAQPPSNLGPKTVVLIPTVTPPPLPVMNPPPQQTKLPNYGDLK